MDDDPLGFETQDLLERADRIIEESVRLRALNAEIRKQLHLSRDQLEWQLAGAVLKK